MASIHETGLAITSLVEEKNSAYGSAVNKTADILKILYPDGISIKDYHDALLVVRVLDKICRIGNSKIRGETSPVTGFSESGGGK